MNPAITRRTELIGSDVVALRRMIEIRAVEDRIQGLFNDGHVRGSTHLCSGQEAVAVALAMSTRPSDHVTCTYRGHGVALALGVAPEAVFAEILGRKTGCAGGCGGSMHLCDMTVGLLPTFAIVGAGIPVAVGAALTSKYRSDGSVAVAVFGDGASNIGAFHEALNMAAVLELPVIFVCENNLYGEYSRYDMTTRLADIADRASGYGIPGDVVDGQDLIAARARMEAAVDMARQGGGATLLEMKTYRYSGHSRSDPADYRPAGELEHWLARDPIKILTSHLVDSGVVTSDQIDHMTNEVLSEVEAAAEAALAAPAPPISAMFEHVTGTKN